MNRRRFLQLSASATGLFALRPLFAADGAAVPEGKCASFLLASDTHYLADKANPGAMDETSRDINARLIEWLNKLPGTDIPDEAGGVYKVAVRTQHPDVSKALMAVLQNALSA